MEKHKVGDSYVCPICGQTAYHNKSHEDMVALYEMVYEQEWDVKEVVLTYDVRGSVRGA